MSENGKLEVLIDDTEELTSYLDGLSASVQEQILELDIEWNELGKKTMQMMYRMGQICREAKELLPHGNYEKWLRSRGANRATASAWANVVLYFQLSQLENFEPSAARMLAAPSLPDALREEAIELAQQLEPPRKIGMREAFALRERYIPERTRREELVLSDPESLQKVKFNPHRLVGLRVQRIRSDRDMSQEDLSNRINQILLTVGAIGLPICGQSAISKVEAGVRSLSFLEGMAAAKVLKVAPDVFAPWNSGRYDWRV